MRTADIVLASLSWALEGTPACLARDEILPMPIWALELFLALLDGDDVSATGARRADTLDVNPPLAVPRPQAVVAQLTY